MESADTYTPTIGNDDDDAKILPSNDTNKSTGTEEVERQLYLENSSGAVFTPLKLMCLLVESAKVKKSEIKELKRRTNPRTTMSKWKCLLVQEQQLSWWCTDLSYSMGVELSSYPDSSVAMVAPPKVKAVHYWGKAQVKIKTKSS